MRTKLFGVLLGVGMSVLLATGAPAEARRSSKKNKVSKVDRADPRVQKYAEILKSGAYATHDDVVKARTGPDGSTRVLFDDGVLAEIRGTVGAGNRGEIRVLIPGKHADPVTVLPKDADLMDGAPGYVAHTIKLEGGQVMPSELRFQPSEKPRNAPMAAPPVASRDST